MTTIVNLVNLSHLSKRSEWKLGVDVINRNTCDDGSPRRKVASRLCD